jgi:O-acetyl-ADP-ribose deacetylase (regulator of RNase III)
MIEFTRGNLLDAQAEALVNTVNEVGVMGKGIALMFRDAFPHNTEEYERAAKAKAINVGKMFVTQNPSYSRPRWIINFPTKKHWRQPSRIEWIRSGLLDLVKVVKELGIKSVALPPLGCGNGGLDWTDVREEMSRALSALDDVEVIIYEPIVAYQGKPKAAGVEKLTIARGLIAELIRRYSVLGLDCTILEVQKLAWFLSREIDKAGLKNPLRLKFVADRYGPYDDNLRHLLNALDGSYIHSEKRLADASPFNLLWFDPSHRAALEKYLNSGEARNYLPVLNRVSELIDGFESPFGMELLATVDWLLNRDHVSPKIDALRRGLSRWASDNAAATRKLALFNDRVLRLALERINALQSSNTGLFA